MNPDGFKTVAPSLFLIKRKIKGATVFDPLGSMAVLLINAGEDTGAPRI